jgi:hypothetical protein
LAAKQDEKKKKKKKKSVTKRLCKCKDQLHGKPTNTYELESRKQERETERQREGKKKVYPKRGTKTNETNLCTTKRRVCYDETHKKPSKQYEFDVRKHKNIRQGLL